MRFFLGYLGAFFFLLPWASALEAKASPSKKNQLEELFIWKLSDELRLTPEKESEFGQLIRKINQRKLEAGQKIEEMTKAFVVAKAKAEKEKSFKNLRKAYVDYDQISIDELDQLKKIIGLDSVGTYLQVKQDLTAKVKNLLMQNEKKESESSEENKAK